MKMVMAVVQKGVAYLSWREGWDVNKWHPDAGDLSEGWVRHLDINEALELSIRAMEYGISKNSEVGHSISDQDEKPDSSKTMPLTNIKFVDMLVNYDDLKPLMFEWDALLKAVATLTGDEELTQFITLGHRLDGKRQTEGVQKEKASATAKKSAASRYRDIPPTEEVKAMFMLCMDQFGGMPMRGGLDIVRFWDSLRNGFEDLWWPHNKKHKSLPVRVVKDACHIREWTKEWKDQHGLLK